MLKENKKSKKEIKEVQGYTVTLTSAIKGAVLEKMAPV